MHPNPAGLHSPGPSATPKQAANAYRATAVNGAALAEAKRLLAAANVKLAAHTPQVPHRCPCGCERGRWHFEQVARRAEWGL